MPETTSPASTSTPRPRPSALAWFSTEAARLTLVVMLVAGAFGLAGATFGRAALRLGPGFSAAAAAVVAVIAVIAGHVLGFRHGPLPSAVQLQLWKVTDELAQYRAFTRLLRDQGQRITGLTADAAGTIVTGLTDMDRRLSRLVDVVERDSLDSEQLAADLRRIGDPVVGMLGALQFQDVTQQQIAFLSRLSLVVDDHMMRLSQQLGDRRSTDRVGEFKAMFDQALDDCVMDSQRDDHHAATNSVVREDAAPKIELF